VYAAVVFVFVVVVVVVVAAAAAARAGDKIEKNEMGGACSTYGEGRGVYRVLVGNLRERDGWGDPGVDGGIILEWIFKKWDVGVRTGLGRLRIRTVGGRF
jgi:hypothetical protein